jgi:hypothetical protein
MASPATAVARSTAGAALAEPANTSLKEEIQLALTKPSEFIHRIFAVPFHFYAVKRNPNFKLIPCNSLFGKVTCDYGKKCKYAHSLAELWRYSLKAVHGYKQRPCKKITADKCSHGTGCWNGHIGDLMCKGKKNSSRHGPRFIIETFYILESPSATPHLLPSAVGKKDDGKENKDDAKKASPPASPKVLSSTPTWDESPGTPSTHAEAEADHVEDDATEVDKDVVEKVLAQAGFDVDLDDYE